MKMKEFEATIGFIDRYTGTEYETVTFYARNKREAKKIAIEKGNIDEVIMMMIRGEA